MITLDRTIKILTILTLLLFLSLGAGCDNSSTSGGGGGNDDNDSDNVPASMAVHAGDGQTAAAGSAVAIAPAVIVRNAINQPVAGVNVVFSVTAGGGAVTGGTVTTGSNGIATIGSWTLGATEGENTLNASVLGKPEIQVDFNATATGSSDPLWTVMVYMAADNNLAVAGIMDIDEMEAAGVHPEVRTVVQAEFSPAHLAQYECDASCFNRPNFNTFRYLISDEGSEVNGPNGSATDIGNRDMTDPADLNEFILWSQANYPAEHYLLVLWNHGGGYLGLLADETSSPGAMMTLSDLETALTGTEKIDIIDFDMCLMGAYETLVKVDGLCDYSVFSEELVPGDGLPYQEVIDAIQANPSASPAEVAEAICSEYHASYSGTRSSTTISAYEMSGLAPFESALDALAGSLEGDIDGLSSVINSAAGSAQSYAYSYLKDLGDFLEQLRPSVNTTIQGEIDAVQSYLTGDFRVCSFAQTGNVTDAHDVDDSNGLTILIPSSSDQLPDQGPGSFTNYQAQYPGAAWTSFLAAYLEGSVSGESVDLGDERWEIYLVWLDEAMNQGVDLDLMVMEPSGEVYVPYQGTVTPNGTLSDDSYDSGYPLEGYLMNRYVQVGLYSFYANLWADPNDFQPTCNIAYRTNAADDFLWLYAQGEEPQLSLDYPIADDPTPTWEEVNNGVYSDLQPVAYLEITGSGLREWHSVNGRIECVVAGQSVPVPTQGPSFSSAQMAKIRYHFPKHPSGGEVLPLRPGSTGLKLDFSNREVK